MREKLGDNYRYTENLRQVGHLGTPVDIAGLAAFPVNDDATFITDESILIDGGRSQVMASMIAVRQRIS
jgi:glucose 1-dehydrogenase